MMPEPQTPSDDAPDPAGAITGQAARSFTGREHGTEVRLIHRKLGGLKSLHPHPIRSSQCAVGLR